jgi:nucleoside transporter
MIADRFFATERVLGVMHILGGAVMLAAPAAAKASPSAFITVLLVHMLCYMPTINLTNTLAFRNLLNAEKQFPIIRVFGTIGWIVANVVVSKMLHADASNEQFYVTGVAAILLGLYAFSLPHTPAPAKGQPVSIGRILGVDALAMLKNPSFAIFVLCSFLICIPLAAYYAFAPVFVGKVGFKDPGFAMSFGQMSEIFFMLVMPLCFRFLGVKWMLAVGMLAWVIRYGAFTLADKNNIEALVMLGIVLHGLCFDFFFVTGFIYTDKKAPEAIRGQAQGLLVLVEYGLGLGIGAQVIGWLVGHFTTTTPAGPVNDWTNIWLYPCLMALAVLLVFVAIFRDKITTDAKH